MRMLGTLCWMLLLGNGLVLPLVATVTTTAHVCDKAYFGSKVCDPASRGTKFFRCLGRRWRLHQGCPLGQLFDLTNKECSRSRDVQTCDGECNPKTCKLPSCRCVGKDIPGKIPISKVPQMVMVTFDDRIGSSNYHYYPQLFWDRAGGPLRNPNNRTTGATFFVSNIGTNMDYVKTVWSKGHEIASHSLTHSSPSSNWTSDHWAREMQGMRVKMAAAVGVSVSEIGGFRAPYLALGGDTQFSMMQHNGFTYDSSFIAGNLTAPEPLTSQPLIWPFTLDHLPTASEGVCCQSNCPLRSYPGLWEVPLIRQYNLDGLPCAMTSGCEFPANASAADVSKFLHKNFLRHYQSNRAPFMVSLHASWFQIVENSLQGLQEFLAEVNADPNVWQVTVSQMLDWVRHPVPMERLGELTSWKARTSELD